MQRIDWVLVLQGSAMRLSVCRSRSLLARRRREEVKENRPC
jgi:hypothetical protein